MSDPHGAHFWAIDVVQARAQLEAALAVLQVSETDVRDAALRCLKASRRLKAARSQGGYSASTIAVMAEERDVADAVWRLNCKILAADMRVVSSIYAVLGEAVQTGAEERG